MAAGRGRPTPAKGTRGGPSSLLCRTMRLRGLAGPSNLGCYSPGPLAALPSILAPHTLRCTIPAPFVLPPPPGKGPPPSLWLSPSHAVSWLHSSLASCHTNLFVSSAHSSNDIFLVPSVSSKLPARAFPPPHLFCLIKKKKHLIWI